MAIPMKPHLETCQTVTWVKVTQWGVVPPPETCGGSQGGLDLKRDWRSGWKKEEPSEDSYDPCFKTAPWHLQLECLKEGKGWLH